MEDKDKKQLAHLQTVLKAFKPSSYSGNVVGDLDPTINESLIRTVDHIKQKLPNDPDAQSLSISVSNDGKISGSISLLLKLIVKTSNIDMYKVFEKSPFSSNKIENEEDLKKAIQATKSGINSMFSGTSQIGSILNMFDVAVKTKNVSDLQAAFNEIFKFQKTTLGSSEKTAEDLAEKKASLINLHIKHG